MEASEAAAATGSVIFAQVNNLLLLFILSELICLLYRAEA